MINCKTTIERLYPFLDRELSDDEYLEVRDHLRRCPPCARHFDFEAGVLRLVGDVCKNVKTPQALIARISAARAAELNQLSSRE